MREGVPASVSIFNGTDIPEYVHWHGFEIAPEVDGTEEEGSLAIPPGGHLQYKITPLLASSRYVHSHAMTMNDLSRGVYSGQFLSTDEWEPRLMAEEAVETAEEDEGESERPSMEIRYGIRSMNGKALGHGEPLRVKEGQRVLFHILNASATEHATLHLPGHKFLVVALDGNPVPHPALVSVLELGVGAFVEMNHPGVWILGSAVDDVRRGGLGIRLEYAYRQGEPQSAASGGLPWDYLSFGGRDKSPKPDEVIPMRIRRATPDAHGLER